MVHLRVYTGRHIHRCTPQGIHRETYTRVIAPGCVNGVLTRVIASLGVKRGVLTRVIASLGVKGRLNPGYSLPGCEREINPGYSLPGVMEGGLMLLFPPPGVMEGGLMLLMPAPGPREEGEG